MKFLCKAAACFLGLSAAITAFAFFAAVIVAHFGSSA